MPIVKSLKGKGFSFQDNQDAQCDSCIKKDYCIHTGKILHCLARETIPDLFEKQGQRARDSFEKNCFNSFERRSLDAESKRIIKKLLLQIRDKKETESRRFYEVNGEQRIVCFTMKEDFSFFEKKLLELI